MSSLKDLKVDDLKRLCREKGLPVGGRKDELIARLGGNVSNEQLAARTLQLLEGQLIFQQQLGEVIRHAGKNADHISQLVKMAKTFYARQTATELRCAHLEGEVSVLEQKYKKSAKEIARLEEKMKEMNLMIEKLTKGWRTKISTDYVIWAWFHTQCSSNWSSSILNDSMVYIAKEQVSRTGAQDPLGGKT